MTIIYSFESQPGRRMEKRYCHQYGADFRDWMLLPGEERRAFLRARPEYDIVNLIENRCPRCSASYQLQ